jgi:uncharacterized protein (DUF2249 family)
MATMNAEPLDVRTIPPNVRHATIFGIIERLEPGTAFSIINDHDPAPLRHQIETRYPSAYSWTYVTSGPGLWLVEIGRLGGAPGEGHSHDGDHPCTCGH